MVRIPTPLLPCGLSFRPPPADPSLPSLSIISPATLLPSIGRSDEPPLSVFRPAPLSVSRTTVVPRRSRRRERPGTGGGRPGDRWTAVDGRHPRRRGGHDSSRRRGDLARAHR